MKRNTTSIIRILGLALWAGAALTATSLAQGAEPTTTTQQISGIVFEDTNHNQALDQGERGVPGVAVSNQRQVAVTDRHGRYSLPVESECVFFVTKPAGWMTPLDKNNLPVFYTIHEPAGAPAGMEYKGVGPTVPLPASLNFPLQRIDEPEQFEILALGDPQVRNRSQLSYFADDIVSELAVSPARAILTLGDLSAEELSILPDYAQTLAAAGKPVYNSAGNHDENYDVDSDRHALETYQLTFGPSYYSFDIGKVHFMMLDTICWRPAKKNYTGKLGERQLEWMKNDLAHVEADRLVVLFGHVPFINSGETGGGRTLNDRAAAFALLKDRPHVLALAGHYHSAENYYGGPEKEWPGAEPFHQIICGATCGCWWAGPHDTRDIPVADMNDGTPNGYYVINFDGVRYQSRYKAAGYDANFRLRISQPGPLYGDEASTRVVVNVFAGSDRTRVECAIDGQPWVAMSHEAMPDPYMAWLLDRYRATDRRWANDKAEDSSHIWTSPLPALAAGSHRVAVRVTEPDGQVYDALRVFNTR